jgi:hypothetical protein
LQWFLHLRTGGTDIGEQARWQTLPKNRACYPLHSGFTFASMAAAREEVKWLLQSKDLAALLTILKVP